jgi:iron(II)-dependent oxidoreductase
MEFVLIPEGRFLMGRDGFDQGESPSHEVSLDSFWISVYEVTRSQFALFLETGGLDCGIDEPSPVSSNSDHPVHGVSWYAARAFTVWLSLRENATYRLPTEAEWERAARGLDGRVNPWGNTEGEPGVHGNWGHDPRDQNPLAPVGTFIAGASPLGVHDMAGNVREWCLDWYDSNYYKYAHSANPFGPTPTIEVPQYRSQRGSGWRDPLKSGHATHRYYANPNQGYDHYGLRVVKEIHTSHPISP